MATKVVKPARISVVNLEPARSRRAPEPSKRKYLPIPEVATLWLSLSKKVIVVVVGWLVGWLVRRECEGDGEVKG